MNSNQRSNWLFRRPPLWQRLLMLPLCFTPFLVINWHRYSAWGLVKAAVAMVALTIAIQLVQKRQGRPIEEKVEA